MKVLFDKLPAKQDGDKTKMDEILQSQSKALYFYLMSSLEFMKSKSDGHMTCTVVKKLSMHDRKQDSKVHPSVYSSLKESEISKDVIMSKCEQLHPTFYYNNLGVIHLKMKKYALASFYLSKSLKYLSLDGKQAHSGGK